MIGILLNGVYVCCCFLPQFFTAFHWRRVAATTVSDEALRHELHIDLDEEEEEDDTLPD
jgi:hypothetical protein